MTVSKQDDQFQIVTSTSGSRAWYYMSHFSLLCTTFHLRRFLTNTRTLGEINTSLMPNKKKIWRILHYTSSLFSVSSQFGSSSTSGSWWGSGRARRSSSNMQSTRGFSAQGQLPGDQSLTGLPAPIDEPKLHNSDQ